MTLERFYNPTESKTVKDSDASWHTGESSKNMTTQDNAPRIGEQRGFRHDYAIDSDKEILLA